MPQSTITTRGQTTLPRPVRQALALRPGDRVRYLLLDGGEVRIARVGPVMDLAGALHRPGRPAVPLDGMEAAIAAGAARMPPQGP